MVGLVFLEVARVSIRKLLIDEAIHNYFHDDTENEMAVKDWFYDLRKQATKADEYEEKAKAWDKLSMSIRKCNKEIELKGGLNAMFRTSKKGQIVQRYIDCFESGEPNA